MPELFPQLCPGAGVSFGIGYIGTMNWQRHFILGLILAGGLCARPLQADALAGDNPYQPIVERNVFGLVPIPTNAPVDPASLVPPPKITPNGIMTIFGKLQVLFKVAGVARPGQPPKDESYVMVEGDRQDEIEVEKIDEASATITFNNHGVIQELPLVAGTASGGDAAPASPGFPQPGAPAPGVAPRGGIGNAIGFGGRFGRSRNLPGASSPGFGGSPGAGSGPSFGGATSTSASTPAAQPAMPVEQQVIMIEAQRMDMLQRGDPTAAIMPPTELTPQVTGQDGSGDGAPAPTPDQ